MTTKIATVKPMTAGRICTGSTELVFSGETVEVRFRVDGKGHDVNLVLRKAEFFAALAALPPPPASVTVAAPVAPAPVAAPTAPVAPAPVDLAAVVTV